MASLRDLINSLRANDRSRTEKHPTTNDIWPFIKGWTKCPDEYKGELFYFLKNSDDYKVISESLRLCHISKDDLEDMILRAIAATTPQDFKHIKGFPPAKEMAAALMEEGYDWTTGDLKALRDIIVKVSNLKADEIPEPYLTAVDTEAAAWLDS